MLFSKTAYWFTWNPVIQQQAENGLMVVMYDLVTLQKYFFTLKFLFCFKSEKATFFQTNLWTASCKGRNFATTRSLCFSRLQTIDNWPILLTTLQQNMRKVLFCGHWTSWQSLIFTNVLTYYVTSMWFRKKAFRYDFSNPHFLPFACLSFHKAYLKCF